MPPIKNNFVYVSNMNMTQLKKITEKEKIDITGLNMKEIKTKIGNDPRNFPKTFDVVTEKWSTRPEDASTYTGGTLGGAVSEARPEDIKTIEEQNSLATQIKSRYKAILSSRLAGDKQMTKTQLQERIRILENEIGARGEHVLAEKWETGDMRHRIKKMVDETTEREEEAKALKAPPKAPPATVAKAPQAPPPTIAKEPPPTPKTSPKNSPTKTDDIRDYKQVKFQGLTKDENSNAKVHVKMAHVQITKSDIEKELERQNNGRFGFQHNKISYNTHWGKQGSKISAELI